MSSRPSALSPADGGTLRASPPLSPSCHSDRRRSASDGKWRNPLSLVWGGHSCPLPQPLILIFRHPPLSPPVSFRPPPERQRRQVEEPASARVGRTLLSAASCKRYKANPYLNPFTTYASDMASEY